MDYVIWFFIMMKLRAIAKEYAPIESSTKMHEPKEVTAKEIKLLG